METARCCRTNLFSNYLLVCCTSPPFVPLFFFSVFIVCVLWSIQCVLLQCADKSISRHRGNILRRRSLLLFIQLCSWEPRHCVDSFRPAERPLFHSSNLRCLSELGPLNWRERGNFLKTGGILREIHQPRAAALLVNAAKNRLRPGRKLSHIK